MTDDQKTEIRWAIDKVVTAELKHQAVMLDRDDARQALAVLLERATAAPAPCINCGHPDHAKPKGT